MTTFSLFSYNFPCYRTLIPGIYVKRIKHVTAGNPFYQNQC